MHCHPIFHVSLLEPYNENEFDDRNVNRRKSINLTTNNFDMIPDKIINMRTYKGKNSFLIFWKGSNEDSQIDEDQILDKQLIQEYFRKNKKNKTSTKDQESIKNDDHTNDYIVRHKYKPFVIELPSRNDSRRSST